MSHMQMPKLRWIQRCAERFLDRHPALDTDQAIELAARLWLDTEGDESPEAAAEVEMALWEDEVQGEWGLRPGAPTLH